MKPLANHTIVQAAEIALRETIALADRPRERLEELVRELSGAFDAAHNAATPGEAATIREVAEAFRAACEQIRTEVGGDSAHTPELEIAREPVPQPFMERAKLLQH
ncbi:hypothetical protein [Roseomonas fluvialis]|uniref:Uncharacterized protein n=1 Tax=Roseomonas fluvialis TaxID=1750527 RepID=A0ABM7Y7T1_9PROT|nr:hypothetical protein [Roseomonas fluvialis]BDG74092.1 hypothetical protein Rmf_40210 [Roseomonas fluvialis]